MRARAWRAGDPAPSSTCTSTPARWARARVKVWLSGRFRVKVRVHRVDARARLLDGLGAELGGRALEHGHEEAQ